MIKRYAWFTLVLLVLLAGAYLAVAFQWPYSSGERAGWVQKFSRKGWVCKTWEGELAMVSLPGSIPEKFLFTVRDAGVAAQINNVVGQRVRLHYEQHRGVPGDCFGETQYWVDGVTPIPESSPTAPAAPAASPQEAAPASAPPSVPPVPPSTSTTAPAPPTAR